MRGDERSRTSFADVAERVDRLAGALTELGVEQRRPRGDVLLEHAASTSRRTSRSRAWARCCTRSTSGSSRSSSPTSSNHAEDTVIIVDGSLVPILEQVAPTFEGVRHFIVIGDEDAGSLPSPLRYEELLAAQEPGFDYPELDDRQAAGDVLHERHHRQPERRPLLAPVVGAALLRPGARRQRRPARGRPRDAGRADVPRERVGAAVRGRAARLRPRAARRRPLRRGARRR